MLPSGREHEFTSKNILEKRESEFRLVFVLVVFQRQENDKKVLPLIIR